MIAGQREATAIVATLGRVVREARKSRRMTLASLATRVGMSVARLSEIERGDGIGTPLGTWVSLGVALDRPLAVTLTRPLGEPRTPADAGHLEIQEHVLALARTTGRLGTFELPTRPTDPARSTDAGIRDDRHRVLILAECWNTIGDLGAAIRATNRKHAEAEAYAIATTSIGVRPHRVATVWILRATAANRRLRSRYPHIIDAAFPGSSRRWVMALDHGGEPPIEPGLVWFDPARRRLTAWRRTG